MNLFRFARADSAGAAIATVAADPRASYIAGGTNIVDLMKDDAVTPSLLVDITTLPFAKIDADESSVRIGALAKMSDVADSPAVAHGIPAVSQALLESASPQLRNMATIGGNIMQRTRCAYFRDVATACNKRADGAGCSALGGVNRMHAIVGGSDRCICVHASDLAVALVAFDAILHLRGPAGDRTMALSDFYLLPGSTPARETALAHGELITAVEIPLAAHSRNSTYLKIRDRSQYEFALVSVAAGLDIAGGQIRAARVALGGVAPVPWRAREAERMLQGQAPSRAVFTAAAQSALRGARGYGQNDYKIPLAQRAIVRALQTASGSTA
jgi:xanthine dehydrogenase YagS FAD-binding subunit